MSKLAKLATRLDTWGAKKRAVEFRTGWASKTRDDIQFFDTGKVQYRYRERGAGPAIVFTADPPVTLELYDEFLDVFAARFRVIVVELPGMGFSAARASYTFGFRETNDGLAEFCEAVAGPGAILAFSCVVGLAAIDIAARRPELVSKLALMQTTDWEGFLNWKTARDPKRILAKPFLGQIAMRRLAKARAPMWFDLSVGNRDKVEPFSCCAEETLSHGAGWALASAYQSYLSSGASPVGKIEQPALVIWGKADRSHNTAASTRAKNIGANVQLVELDSAGHFPELEETRKAYEIITGFVDG
ncbi:MAG: alpha/beta hydrolase [Alphaproteobacteria bacterium]|nr:alpha/beta hydrolase [Alphaproteobacteria bacterium]